MDLCDRVSGVYDYVYVSILLAVVGTTDRMKRSGFCVRLWM